MNRRELFQSGAGLFAIPAAWAQSAARPAWTPAILDSHANETVIALSDVIIPATDTPGAKAANVNRFVDLFLRDGDPASRQRFLDGLHWIDALALRRHGAPFIKCTAAQQIAIATDLDAGSEPASPFFGEVKALIARIYYATETGFRELNKGNRVPSSYGCAHPEHG